MTTLLYDYYLASVKDASKNLEGEDRINDMAQENASLKKKIEALEKPAKKKEKK